jgi:hypothetical protein
MDVAKYSGKRIKNQGTGYGGQTDSSNFTLLDIGD